MADIDRKFVKIEGVVHRAGCSDAIGRPCDCGAEMEHALRQLVDRFDDDVDGVPEGVELDPRDAEWTLDIPAGAIRDARQALANLKAGREA